MNASKQAILKAEQKSSGVKLVEKYRPRMSRLSDAQRQELMSRGLGMVYGDTPAAESTHRR